MLFGFESKKALGFAGGMNLKAIAFAIRSVDRWVPLHLFCKGRPLDIPSVNLQ